MSISESDRRAIFDGLQPILGTDTTDNLLAMLPNQPVAQLVTTDAMHANTLALRGDMTANTTMLRGEMAELRGELRGEMAELRGDLRGEMAELRGDLRGEMADLRVTTQRWMSGAVAANTIAVVTALLT